MPWLFVLVMTPNGIEHHIVFVVSPGDLLTNLDMRPLRHVIGSLANIMQQAGPPGQVGIHPELSRHHTGQEGGLFDVLQDILRVARPVLQTPEQLDDLGVQIVYPDLKGGGFPRRLSGPPRRRQSCATR